MPAAVAMDGSGVSGVGVSSGCALKNPRTSLYSSPVKSPRKAAVRSTAGFTNAGPWVRGSMGPSVPGSVGGCIVGPLLWIKNPATHGPRDPRTQGPTDPGTHGPMDPPRCLRPSYEPRLDAVDCLADGPGAAGNRPCAASGGRAILCQSV